MKTAVIGNDVLAVLSACRIEGLNVFLPGERLDIKLYTDTNKILENLGGKWNRKAQAHVFSDDPAHGLDQCIRTGKVTLLSKNGFFPTPAALADRMVDELNIKPVQTILEPSCGDGSLLNAIRRSESPGLLKFVVFEKNPELARKVTGFDVQVSDFMQAQPQPVDRVLMNPPFEILQDCEHTMRAFNEWLRPGGRLVGIMGLGVTFRREQKATDALAMIERYGNWEELPPKTFRESGTDVNTIMVVLDKPE